MIFLSDSAFHTLLNQLVTEKGFIFVCKALNHKNTSRVQRWIKEKKVPKKHKLDVLELFSMQGIIK